MMDCGYRGDGEGEGAVFLAAELEWDVEIFCEWGGGVLWLLLSRRKVI